MCVLQHADNIEGEHPNLHIVAEPGEYVLHFVPCGHPLNLTYQTL